MDKATAARVADPSPPSAAGPPGAAEPPADAARPGPSAPGLPAPEPVSWRRRSPTGVSLSRFDLALRLGLLRDPKGDSPGLPLYGTLAVTMRF